MSRPVLVEADAADLDHMSLLVAAAFQDLDPSRWLVSDPDIRRAIFPAYFRLLAAHGLRHGRIYTNPERSAVAIWLPVTPGTAPDPTDYQRGLAAVTGAWADRFRTFDAALESHHPQHTAYQWLAILAVAPAQQGRGIGTGLLSACHRRLDDTGTPAYLEASDHSRRALYQRRGYTDVGEPIRLPDGPCMYPMWREPARLDTPPLRAAVSQAAD